jgi:hypothetical protein
MPWRPGWTALLLAGLALGTLDDCRPWPAAPAPRGGYQVLAVDLHVHSFLGDGALGPWDLIGEARRRGLQAFAITNHNQVATARLGRWLSRRWGGPIVLVGEEVTHPLYHLIAVGIETPIDARVPAAAAMEQIHAQGGVAIAAHPIARFWPGYDEAALKGLDGAERVHPLVYAHPDEARELEQFWERAQARRGALAPIGSSDFHVGSLGLCRTYVFATEASERGILEAIRAGRTVAYDEGGRAHGDPAWQRLLAEAPPRAAAAGGGLRATGAVCSWLGLLGLALLGDVRSRPPAAWPKDTSLPATSGPLRRSGAIR